MFDNATVQLIVSGAFGIPVVGVTEMIKLLIRGIWPDVGRWLGYVVSAVVSAIAVFLFVSTLGAFSWLTFGGYTFLCWLVANGFYKST